MLAIPLTRTVRRARLSVPARLTVAVLITVVALAGCGPSPTIEGGIRIAGPAAPTESPTPSPTPEPTHTPTPTPTPAPTTKKPTTATTKAQPPSNQWVYATTTGPVLGGGSPLRFAVTVEASLGIGVDGFAAKVNEALGDPRSWIAGGVTLQQVPASAATFTIYLATPNTAYQLCSPNVDIRIGGVPYTSCRNGNRVVINSDRWLHGVPNYGASLDVYQLYVINHEVGHRLGHGHERCPAAGQPDPVMAQQTLGLQGCVANSWPYLNGSLYSGPPL